LPLFSAAISAGSVDQLSAAGIHHVGAWLHAGEGFRVEHVERRRSERRVERHDVARLQQARERGVLAADRIGPRLVGIGVGEEQAGVEAAEDLRRDATDAPRSDDANRLSREVETEQSPEREVLLAHAVERSVDLAVQRQQQADGVFRDGVRRVGRDARRGDLQGPSGGEVQVVVAGAAHRDHLHVQLAQRFQAGTIEHVVHEGADGAGAARGGSGFRGEAGLDEAPRDAASSGQG
jgi:hypothetical protein